MPKPKEEPKTTTGLRNTINKTKQLLETSIPVSSDAPGLLKSTSHSSLSKQPQSPTTNLQIRIQPLKKPEIVFTDVTPNSPHKSMESLDKVLGAGAEQSQSEAGKVKEPKPGVAIQNTVNSSVMAPNATPEIPESDCSNVEQEKISFIPVSSKVSIPKVKDISESIMVKDGGSSCNSKEQSDSDRQDSVKSNSNISSTASK